jgi:hypothetical protein
VQHPEALRRACTNVFRERAAALPVEALPALDAFLQSNLSQGRVRDLVSPGQRGTRTSDGRHAPATDAATAARQAALPMRTR